MEINIIHPDISTNYKIKKRYLKKRVNRTFLRHRSEHKKACRDYKNFIHDNKLFCSTPSGITNKKIVVYTCIFGGYDDPPRILKKDPNCDYYIITDLPKEKCGDWAKLDLTLPKQQAEDKTMLNRFFKINPQNIELFEKYEYSIYLDGNIDVIGELTPYIYLLNDKVLGAYLHPNRNCIYQEAKKLSLRKAPRELLFPRVDRYRSEGFPENFGLTHNCFLVRKHNDNKCIKLMKLWWEETSSNVHRDQLSLMYCVWKIGMTINDLALFGSNVDFSCSLNVKPHNHSFKKKATIKTRISDYIYNLITKGRFSDSFAVRFLYKRKYGKKMNIKDPISFSEKINWLKIYNHNPLLTYVADKATFKKYVSKKLGDDNYTFKTFGIYKNVEEIDLSALPPSFVIKATHDSGSIMIVKDKKYFDKEYAVKWFNQKLSKNYYFRNREWSYKNVIPQLIVEEYISELSDINSVEYKFFTSFGDTKFLSVQSGKIHTDEEMSNFFDSEFNPIDVSVSHEKRNNRVFKQPTQFGEMKKIAKLVSSDFPFARVDFCIIGGGLYLTEITFYPHAGFINFVPDEYDTVFGKMIDIKK